MAQENVQAQAQPVHSASPRHVAIIMDGNGRWAKRRNLPRYLGHREGVKAVRRIVTACQQRGIEVLTLFAFSNTAMACFPRCFFCKSLAKWI